MDSQVKTFIAKALINKLRKDLSDIDAQIPTTRDNKLCILTAKKNDIETQIEILLRDLGTHVESELACLRKFNESCNSGSPPEINTIITIIDSYKSNEDQYFKTEIAILEMYLATQCYR